MTTYQKYTWVCTGDCDALIEYTIKDGYGWPAGVMDLTCRCNSNCTLLSVEDATIQPTTKGMNMLDNLEASLDAEETKSGVPDTYNSNLLVTYKVIRGYSDPEYTTDKVVNIEWELHNGRQAQKRVGMLESNINTVKNIITEVYADSDDQDTLRAIAEALNIELTRTVEFTATIEVSGTIDLNLLEDYDFETEITDNLYVDSQSGNIEIGDTEICYVREA
jgi:hypothetical protein